MSSKRKTKSEPESDEAKAERLKKTLNYKYKDNDIVLAMYNGRLYEAKILSREADVELEKPAYLVHYQNWNNRFDEVLLEEDMFEDTPENRQKKAEMDEQFKAEKNKRGKKGATPTQRGRPTKKAGSPQPKKRRIEDSVAPPDDDSVKQIALLIPNTLQRQLLLDWDFIKTKKLVSLPRDPNVKQILERWVETKGPTKKNQQQVARNVANGIQNYFDRSLGCFLLYRFERVQYRQYADQPNFCPSEVYGAEHLLRLFIRMPQLLAESDLPQSKMNAVVSSMADFLKFLSSSSKEMFLPQYNPADESYITQYEELNASYCKEEKSKDEMEEKE